MTRPELPLPDNCRVRLVDLPVQAGGMIAVDESGFVNIYLNARLSLDAQREALQHELRHHYRGDLYSERDIRAVERDTRAAGPTTLDGCRVEGVAAPFAPEGLKAVGRGLYLPTGQNRALAAAHIDEVRRQLVEACDIYDVMQTPPLIHREALSALAAALRAGDIAFIAWQIVDGRPRAMLHFSREGLYGAIYYAPGGAVDNALAVLRANDMRVSVDLRTRAGRLEVFRIVREIGDRAERVY